jgi:hypothetical protein
LDYKSLREHCTSRRTSNSLREKNAWHVEISFESMIKSSREGFLWILDNISLQTNNAKSRRVEFLGAKDVACFGDQHRRSVIGDVKDYFNHNKHLTTHSLMHTYWPKAPMCCIVGSSSHYKTMATPTPKSNGAAKARGSNLLRTLATLALMVPNGLAGRSAVKSFRSTMTA